MTTLKDRERADEKKFALKEETQFKVNARRHRLFGEWAAGLLGHAGDAARDYAMSVVQLNLSPGQAVEKVTTDLAGRVSAEEVAARFEEFLDVASSQFEDAA